MAASTVQNPSAKLESKSAKKKKANAAAPEVEAPATTTPEATPSAGPTESVNGDGAYESPYIKELYKNIRNVNKKITNASKVDNIVAENAGKTLDELVSERKINKDQKEQILKKPALQASLAQLEEQIAQYKKFDQEYRARSQAEKAEFEKGFNERAERDGKEHEEALAAAKADAKDAATKEHDEHLLILTQFLKLAAIRRLDEEAAETDENKALEGLLVQVYGGNAEAVSYIHKLVEGVDEPVQSTTGEVLRVTFADLKSASAGQANAVEEETPAAASDSYPVGSDPTIANAGLTEIDEPSTIALSNGDAHTYDNSGAPPNSGFGEGAANAAAEANWDKNNDLSASQEWVEVSPRDAAETDAATTPTPAPPSKAPSWADEQPETTTTTTATTTTTGSSAAPPAPQNDGFQEIQRNRGGRGGFRGEGRGGRSRGGRGRGEGHRGRGRGGANGGRGGSGARRGDES